MDSWKGMWLSEELGFPTDSSHERCRNKEMGYEIKPFSNVEVCPLVSNTQALERLDFMDLGFSYEIRKTYSVSSGDVFSSSSGGGEIATESGSQLSADFMQSNGHDCPLIDLKLGKRGRSTTMYPRSNCCQVFGCNKDLSSFKGYYKRHKVCDVHTKTSKVIVGGIEQRFCQQCSRFHLLAEFDDGKRSCRRRLAAHNKRRRKPQLNSQPGTGMSELSSSFSFQEVLPSIIVGSGERMENFPTGVKENIVAIGNLNIQSLSNIHQDSSTSALSLLSVPL